MSEKRIKKRSKGRPRLWRDIAGRALSAPIPSPVPSAVRDNDTHIQTHMRIHSVSLSVAVLEATFQVKKKFFDNLVFQ